jgi:hypothetical protein
MQIQQNDSRIENVWQDIAFFQILLNNSINQKSSKEKVYEIKFWGKFLKESGMVPNLLFLQNINSI